MTPRIAIIGSGVAGLSSARILSRTCQVSIFEARDRIGGRVYTDRNVDLGASFIHGIGTPEEPNSFMDIVREAKAHHADFEAPSSMFDPHGHSIPEAESANVTERFWTMFEEGVQYAKEHTKEISPTTSLYDYMEDSLQKEDATFRERCLQYAMLWSLFVGTDIRKQSLKFLYFEEPAAGATTYVTNTYRDIVTTLAVPVKHLLQLDTEVTSITNTSTDVQVSFRDSPDQTFDAVLVTVPLGCLKHKTITFSPALPSRLESAIASLGWGNLEKVYFRYPSTWWPKRTGSYSFLAPEYNEKNHSKQLVSAISLAQFDEDAQPTLLFFVYEPVSSWLAAGPGDEAIKEFFRPYIERIPGYDASNPDCQPEVIGHSTWSKDKFSGYGSYTNFQTGPGHLDEDIKVIREGLPDRKVWFAGEHVPPKIVGIGTVNSAFHSGEAVAKRMLDAL